MSSQADGSTQRHGGAAWGQLGMWGWKVWAQGSRVWRALVFVVMHIHPCSRVFRRAWHCPFLGVCFGVGRTGDAESGRAPWLVSGSVQVSSAHAQGQTGLQLPPVPPDPPDTPCSLPQALLGVVSPSCTRCQPPSRWEGSAPFIATSCPFQPSALSFIFCKSSPGPLHAQVRVWEL